MGGMFLAVALPPRYADWSTVQAAAAQSMAASMVAVSGYQAAQEGRRTKTAAYREVAGNGSAGKKPISSADIIKDIAACRDTLIKIDNEQVKRRVDACIARVKAMGADFGGPAQIPWMVL